MSDKKAESLAVAVVELLGVLAQTWVIRHPEAVPDLRRTVAYYTMLGARGAAVYFGNAALKAERRYNLLTVGPR